MAAQQCGADSGLALERLQAEERSQAAIWNALPHFLPLLIFR